MPLKQNKKAIDIDLYMKELREFIAIPSVSSEPDCRSYMQEAADWLVRRLESMGTENVKVHNYRDIPLVTGDLFCGNSDAPVLLLYGHYDVQPAGPESEWSSSPFQAEIREDSLYGRGTTDMKGQILALFAALDLILANGESSWNFKFFFEGAEESDASLIEGFIMDNKELLQCDLVLNVDAGMIGRDSPTIIYGSRGIALAKLTVSGPKKDLHCGEFGGVLLNPVHAISRAVAELHDAEGKVNLPGFYDGVSVSEKERELLSQLPMDDNFFLKETGVKKLRGEPGFSALERSLIRPALEVVDIDVSGMISSISPEATALLIFRLVPGQDPDRIRELLEKYLYEIMSDAVEWRIDKWIGCRAAECDTESWAVTALKKALQTAWNKEPLLSRTGGSLPMADYFQRSLGVEVLLTGFQLPEDNMHGPNEKLHIPTWEKGVRALELFFRSALMSNQ